MKEQKRFFQLVKDENSDTADLYIFGDICAWAYTPAGEQSGFTLVNQLEQLEAENINVHINSYGGDVSEGLAIYNTLKNHKANITTICDGFACSAASLVFMAGDKRVMNPASLLMVHNAWMCTAGNADQLRKAAEDIEVITQATVEVFKERSSISEDEIKALMDAETWILPTTAVEYGFATEIAEPETDSEAQQSAFDAIIRKLTAPEAKLDFDKIAEEISAKVVDAISTKATQKPEKPDSWASFFGKDKNHEN